MLLANPVTARRARIPAALAKLSASSLGRTSIALRHLREGLRPLSAALAESRTLDPLKDAVSLLGVEETKGLPVFSPPGEAGGFVFYRRTVWGLDPLFKRDAFLALRKDERRLAALVDLPFAQRTPPLQKLEREERKSRNPHRIAIASTAMDASMRVDRQRIEVDMLLALALARVHRAEHGQWPSTPPALYPRHPVFRPTPVRMHGGPDDTLVLEPEEALVADIKALIDPQEQAGALMDFAVTATP